MAAQHVDARREREGLEQTMEAEAEQRMAALRAKLSAEKMHALTRRAAQHKKAVDALAVQIEGKSRDFGTAEERATALVRELAEAQVRAPRTNGARTTAFCGA